MSYILIGENYRYAHNSGYRFIRTKWEFMPLPIIAKKFKILLFVIGISICLILSNASKSIAFTNCMDMGDGMTSCTDSYGNHTSGMYMGGGMTSYSGSRGYNATCMDMGGGITSCTDSYGNHTSGMYMGNGMTSYSGMRGGSVTCINMGGGMVSCN